MGRLTRPDNLGDFAERSYIAEQRTGLDWWQVCITSALIDLNRVPGFVTAFAGIANVLRHGASADWVIGGSTFREAVNVTLEWLDADIAPHEVAGWLQAGCWSPTVATQLVAAGIRPGRLLSDDGRPVHWLQVADGNEVPLATAITEWDFPIAEAVRIVTGMAAYEVSIPNTRSTP